MTRAGSRWGDEDDDPRQRRPRAGMSPAVIVLLALGGVFLLGALLCGGVLLIGYRKAQNVQQELVDREEVEREREARERAEADRAEAQRRLNQIGGALRKNEDAFPQVPPNFPDPFGGPPADPVPPPKPGFDPAPEPPPQPKPTKFATDDPKNPGRWRILFRSRKPELWNTNTQTDDDFAIPLQSTLAKTKYLRLRRMDTGEAIIIPMMRERIGRPDAPGRKARWNGEGKDEYGGYHLGIAEGPAARFAEGKGTIGVLMDGWDANPGSGFGHAHHIENGGQRYSWKGKEIPPTAFEIAVTVDELTEKDREWLRE